MIGKLTHAGYILLGWVRRIAKKCLVNGGIENMMTMRICRNQRGGLFLCTSGTVYDKIEDIWTECIGHPIDCDTDYQDVTFENSPRIIQLKLAEE